MSLRIASFCSGFGGLEMAVQAVFGGETVFHADPDPGASKILARHWPKVPNLGDLRFIHWARTRRQYGPIDIAAMGFPCTDLSLAGLLAGLAPGTRSGVWLHCAAGIQALNPRIVVIENVRGLLSAPAHSDVEPCPWCVGDGDRQHLLRALGAVLGDLADLGFDAEWIGLPASDPAVGSCHQRWREFILAWKPGALEDADIAAGSEWRTPAPGQAQGRGARPDAGGRGGVPSAAEADAGAGLTLLPTPAARDWKSGASNLMDKNSRPLNEFVVNRLARRGDWVATNGVDYGPAIRRWEDVTGHQAPEPTEPGDAGNRRLNPAFSEWMLGLKPGHVTAVPGLSREDQLRAIGNGVVWRQGAHALRLLHARAVYSLGRMAAAA